MMSLDPAYCNLIQFVPENAKDRNCKATDEYSKISHCQASGKEIKDFYESIITEQFSNVPISSVPDTSIKNNSSSILRETSRHEKSKKKCEVSNSYPTMDSSSTSSSNQTITREQRQNFQLLKSAQFGNLTDVQNLLKQGLNINFRDFYGWTAMMCAAREGHSDIVDFLLQSGADVNIVNSDGYSAALLAKNAGHHHLALKLMNYRYSIASKGSDHQEHEKYQKPSKLYCQNCKSEFYRKDKTSHDTSVVHLLNSAKKHKKHFYFIPETNRGFQMLLKTGWEKDKGLGPKGDGCKYPLKTIMKQDRAGLGDEENSKKKAKVTHFGPSDISAIRNQPFKNVHRTMSARKAAKYATKVSERKQKSFEQKLRLELSGDF